jgi:hypothetical protein
MFRHALLGGVSLLVGVVALWSMNRPRKDHQSLGWLALLLGLVWSTALLLTGESGYRLAHGGLARPPSRDAAASLPPAPVQVPQTEQDPEAKAPVRALDHASLEAIHPEPVKSPAHGGRWIRAWATPEAAAAYRSGQPLPPGAFVVLSTVEDRWGRPGHEVGPLYVLELKATGPTLTFYWPRIPMERRREFGGDSRAYWRGSDPQLGACLACHAKGMAEPAQRSRWRVPRLQERSN